MQVLEDNGHSGEIKLLSKISKRLPGKQNNLVNGWIKRLRNLRNSEDPDGIAGNIKGVVNEMDDADYFLSRGYTVERASGEPGDLVVSKNGVKFRIECKLSEEPLTRMKSADKLSRYLDKFVEQASKYGEKPAVVVKGGIKDPELLSQLKDRGITIFRR